MARLHSDLGQRTVYLADGTARADEKPCVVFKDAAGTQLANLAVYDPNTPGTPGAAIAGAELVVDAYSNRPAFWDLDDLPVLYITVSGKKVPADPEDWGPLVPILPDAQPQIDAAVAGATAQATAARDAAIAASIPRTAGKNLFDEATAQFGKFWNGTGPNPIDLANWYASPLIPVTAGQTYTINNCRNLQRMDSAGQPVAGSYVNNTTEVPITLTIPAGTVSIAINISPANLPTCQIEVGSAATAYEPYGYVVARQVAGGRYLDDVAGDANALRRMPGVTVYRAGNSLLVRSAFDTTRDILMPWNLAYGEESQVVPTIDATVPNSNVTLVPAATSGVLVWPTIATGTAIHGAIDDNAPINVQWCYIGGNHGWTAWNVTASGHGKTTADVGSTWSDGLRTFTLIAVVSSSVLLFAGPYTVSSGVVTSPSAAPGATLTHVSGATATAAVPITGGVAATQIHPSSYAHTATAALDGRVVAEGKSAGQVLTISESYLIASYKGLIDWAQANVGSPVLANLSSVPALARVSNTYRVTAAQVVVAQKVTAVEKTIVNMGVTQAYPLTLPAGGSRKQFMAGVGTVNGANFSTYADLTAFSTQVDVGPASYANPLVPAASMTQWAYNGAGVAQYGLALGYLPTGDGHPTQRIKNAAAKSWFISGTVKKNYPQLAWGRTLLPGESLAGTAYRRYLPPPFGPTELVVSDGADTWAIIERTDAAAETRMAAPELLGRRLVPVGVATVTAADRVTGDGITYTAPTAGFGVFRADPVQARLETLPGATNGTGTYFVMSQGTVATLPLSAGNFQVLYLHPMYLPESTLVDRACIEVTALGTGVIRHGVYLNDPATGQPATSGPLADFGTVDVTSTGVKESTVAALLPAGWHWYGVVWQGLVTTPPTLRIMSVGHGLGPLNIGTSSALISGNRLGYFVSGVTGALGALALSSSNAHALPPPRLAYRRA